MYQKENTDKEYRENPFRAVNFGVAEDGGLICPDNKKFLFLRDIPVKGNRYGRTEELYQCEDCSDCPYKDKCTKAKGNRTIRLCQVKCVINFLGIGLQRIYRLEGGA